MMKPVVAAAAVLALSAGYAMADRMPTPDERTAVENALKSAGYTSWGKIEMDDGHWDVDAAIGPDGKPYDVDLAPGDLKIIKAEIDLD